MSVSSQNDCSSAIIGAVGGAQNIKTVTHCATRLRFELHDASQVNKETLEAIPQVLGAVPQSGDRYQVIIGGAVQSVFNQINNNPLMAHSSAAAPSDADIKAQARSKVRGKFHWLDSLFEYLSDSFRPILGVLLGASLIIAFAAVLDALNIVDFRATDKSATWIFVDAMWQGVFSFLPVMVAYNAAKKLNVDPWVGSAIMCALLTPEFLSLSDPTRFPDTVCVTNELLGTDSCTAHIFGLPMQLNGYSGNVFVPLIMAAVLGLVYHGLKKVFPANIQMVFVPFFSLAVMIPLTAFLIGPLGVWLGNGIGAGLAWLNGNAPFVFAILIPMIYPFLVPLGLHWPLNALMLMNIQTLGYDFIQGPMGAWNFACFGATAGVLAISIRDKDNAMRQTALGALAAGLLGGISEPSLYGIHLRFKRIYPRMLAGCAVGGIVIAILGTPFGGVRTQAFVFTSVLTIPVFNPLGVYAIAVACAFVTSMLLIFFTGYKDKNESALPGKDQPAIQTTTPPAHTEGVVAAIAGRVVDVTEVPDPVFSSEALGKGVGIYSQGSQVCAPISGTVISVAETSHAYGIKSDDGVEVLIHVGIDTVKMDGEGFDPAVTKGQRVNAGDLLVTVDFAAIERAGYDTITIMTVTNSAQFAHVNTITGTHVTSGEQVISIER